MKLVYGIITFPMDCLIILFATLFCLPMKDRLFCIRNFPTTILWQDIPEIIRVAICVTIYFLIYINIK